MPRSQGSAAAAMLREFHAVIAPLNRPVLAATVATRRALMAEEYQEYHDAEESRDLVKIADALADIVYVAYGTALCYGFDLDAVLAEVHASNMSKDPVPAAGGKAVKGPHYRPPDIGRVLAASRAAAGPVPRAPAPG
jgi:predicted HAD superfamily Cof-like phosphohydrolase